MGKLFVLISILWSGAASPTQAVHLRPETGHYYVWISDSMKWDDADKFAHKFKATVDGIVLDKWHLATITDASENAFVFNVLLKTATGGPSFIGAIAPANHPRHFAWVTGEPFVYQNFAAGQPDEARENVLEMGGSWGASWNNQDGPGSPYEERESFILEHEPVPLPCPSVTVTTVPNVFGTER